MYPELNDCNGGFSANSSLPVFDPSDMSGMQFEVQGSCENTVGSFVCQCPMYYRWDMNSSSCVGECPCTTAGT